MTLGNWIRLWQSIIFFFFFSMGKCYKYGFLTTDPMFSLYALTSEFLQDSGLPFL